MRLAVVAGLAFVAVVQVHRLEDGDVWWHLAGGRYAVEHRVVPATDPFSYTAPGAEWVNRQWLFDVALYAAWAVAGPAGSSLLAGGLSFLGLAALFVLARRHAPPWAALVLAGLATQAAVDRFEARPEALTFAALGATLLLVDGPLGWGAVAALLAVQLVWSNGHALAVLGLLVVGAHLVGALIGRGLRIGPDAPPGRIARLAVATAGTALAQLATPFGVRGALLPLELARVIGQATNVSATVLETRPTVIAELRTPTAVVFTVLLTLGAAALVAGWRRWRPGAALVAVGITVLAFMVRRNVALIGFGVVPLVAMGLGPLLQRADARLGAAGRAGVGLGLAATFAALVVGVATGRYYGYGTRWFRVFGLGESSLFAPTRAVTYLIEHAPPGRVFNDDVLGGYLAWRGVPVFLDGRFQMYPSELVDEYLGVLADPSAFGALAAHWGVTAAILCPPRSAYERLAVVQAINQLPGWRIAYVDANAVVLFADGADASATVEPTVEPFWAPGLAGVFEAVAGPLRPPYEEIVFRLQRAKTLATLGGQSIARYDLEAAEKLWPDFVRRYVQKPAP